MKDINKLTEPRGSSFNRTIKPSNNIIANYLSKKASLLKTNCAMLNQDVLETEFKDNQWFLDYLDELNIYSGQY